MVLTAGWIGGVNMLKDYDLTSARSNLEVCVQRNTNTGMIEITFFVDSPGSRTIGRVNEDGCFVFEPIDVGALVPSGCILKMPPRMAAMMTHEIANLLKVPVPGLSHRSAVHNLVDKIVDSGIGMLKMDSDSNGVKIETYIGERIK